METIITNKGNTMIVREVLGDWEATTKENFNSPIRDERFVFKFGREDYNNIDEVIDYVVRWF